MCAPPLLRRTYNGGNNFGVYHLIYVFFLYIDFKNYVSIVRIYARRR